MGCYMSIPDNRVYVTEGKGKNFVYATASCQGWRREQEDAEDCIPFFDENASLFVLCDGHGGAEVAKYTVEHLPNFIKNHPLYKEGKYEEALEKAFIDFDALLRTDEVMSELHKLAFDSEDDRKDENKDGRIMDLKDETQTPESSGPSGSSAAAGTSSSNNGSSTVVDDVDTDTLRREAQVPLRDLLDEYSAISGIDQAKRHGLISKFNASPVVRAKHSNSDDNEDENGEGPASSSTDALNSSLDNQPGPSSSSKLNEDEPSQGPSTSVGSVESIKETLIRQVIQHYFPEDDTSDDSEFDGEGSSNDDDGDDEGDDDGGDSSKKLRRKKHKRPTEGLVSSSSEDDSDDDDDDEEEDDDDDDDDDDEDEGDDEEDDEEKDEEADDEEGDGEDQWEDIRNVVRPPARAHKPGLDSGCTVVVALVKDGKLYVASAGDSRCIMIMRNGECKPMSFDHKPEDYAERRRISKAGGRVTEGRVNGGLNLSRALGDFTYKSPGLDAKDQMITPCPDVKTADLDPNEVEYIFLACDGIWNSMKNQQATKFIRKVAPTVGDNLVEICLNLFRTCIAPRTDGDGTGCDNMTCIIAKFENSSTENLSINSDLNTEVNKSENSATPSSHKRSTNDENNDMPTKRKCIRL